MLPDVNAWLESGTGIRHPLNGPCSIGRLAENQIVIDDSKVSRQHALLYPQPGVGYWLLDFGSSNGPQLNGRNLLKSTLLQNLDRISIGGTHFSFRQPQCSTSTRRDSSAPRTAHVSQVFAAIGHHSVILGRELLAHGKNEGAHELLRRFFSEPFEWPALPCTLLRRIEQQNKLRKSGTAESALAEPFLVEKNDRRLVIRLEPVPRNQMLLLLTEERSALSAEILQQLRLTERESEILHLVAHDKNNAEIAKELNLNTRTVEKHIEHILAKLGASSRMGALLRIKELAEKMPGCRAQLRANAD